MGMLALLVLLMMVVQGRNGAAPGAHHPTGFDPAEQARADAQAAAQAAAAAAANSQQATRAAAQPAPWPTAVPKDLPPWPSGWVADNPPPKAVVNRAWQLLPSLWKRGAGARAVEQTGGRWISYVATSMGKGIRGVTAFRAATEPQAQPQPQPVANA